MNNMEMREIKDHWTDWATTYGEQLKATTKTPTIKELEIDVLARAITQVIGTTQASFTMLEVGCGNGLNCMALAQIFPNARIDGLDYVPEMVEAAEAGNAKFRHSKNLRFHVGNALNLSATSELREVYDIVLTDRCLINLNTIELQKKALVSIARKIKRGGHFAMLENSLQTYEAQNECRALLGMKPRTPALYNLFIDEKEIVPHLDTCGLDLIDVEDFGSLHDLLLYVLLPFTNSGEVDYAHPLVKAATMLSKHTSQTTPSAFGRFGQNRLYLCRKTSSGVHKEHE
ncbi:MAG TPA: class I SAM-dependent methyltransferase [Terriglobales bacterium]|nr:class I SAM-dependent methyltransferase [Terriglobales bacterium]